MLHENYDEEENSIHNPFYSPDIKDPVDEDWAAKRVLAQELRTMIESLVTCTADAKALSSMADVIKAQTAILQATPQMYGRSAYSDDNPEKYKTLATVGYELNPLDGESNPIAAPMKVWIEDDVAHGTAHLGWAYEGPPNSIHGGFVAAIFDQFLGIAQKITGQPGVTGTLSVRYIKPTPLCTDIKLVGRVQSVEGRKNILVGEMWAGDVLTATCEGLFIRLNPDAYQRMREALPKQ
jgi:acyl-coenzyme A thioesterase PaaI-like protein